MSGPIRPPLRVRDSDSSPNVIPVNTIVVSDGDLVDDGGAIVTIDTSGSGTEPATPADAIQFNSDPAGTFTADSNFKMQVIGGDGTTSVKIGNIVVGANGMKSVVLNESVHLTAEGTGQVFLYGSEDGGGTFSDTVVNVMCWENADDAVLRLRNQNGVAKEANIIFDGSSDLILTNTVAAKDIDLKVLTTGQVEVANQTTDTDTVLSILGNGTGAPRLDLQNASKRVWVECQSNKQLTIQGGSGGDTFVFDVSSATGGIQFPDGTSLISAEGTAILSTGETGGSKFLREDGDGTCSWQTAGGGSASFNPVLPKTIVSADRHKISLAAPYGGTALEVNAQFADSQTCRGYPFIAPKSGDVTEIGIVVGTSTTSADCLVGIYSDNSGEPETLMGYADIEMSSTGAIYQTSISATVTLVEQTQYWFVIGGDDTITGGTLTALDDDYTCDLGIGWSPNGKGFCITHNASVTALPATFVPTSVHGTPRPLVSLKIG